MKVLVYGQATGGNALTWFNYFNRVSDSLDVSLLARTACTLKHNFPVYKPYGKKEGKGAFSKIRKKIASQFLVKIYLSYLYKNVKPDLVILQGNYTPSANLNVINALKCRTILNIYGSDFYRKYKKNEFSDIERKNFIEVLDKVDIIMCNWKSTFDDFVVEFPKYKNKTHAVPWGIDIAWSQKLPDKVKRDNKHFISTRALHSYNNVDMVVEAFCQAYPSPSENTLHIIGAYGNDKKVVRKIQEIIKNYNLNDRVKLELDKWYEGDDLIRLYDGADYNLCFGNTDQLTISISYAFTRGVVNILSPLKNYHHLLDIGYVTPKISSEISVSSLIELFQYIEKGRDDNSESLLGDRKIAIDMFDMNKTFSTYIDLVSELKN